VEGKIKSPYERIDEGPLSEYQLTDLKNLKEEKISFLKKEEDIWRLKRKA